MNRIRVARRDVPGAMAVIMLEVAADFGVDAAQVLRGTGLEHAALLRPDARFTMRDYSRMLGNCITGSREPGFALHFGSRISVAALGELGYALMCCSTVHELVDVLTRYDRLISGSFHINVLSDRDALTIELAGGMIEATVQPMDCEIFFAAAAASLRQLAALPATAIGVTLAYEDPGYGALYRRLVCPELRFAGMRNAMRLDRRVLDIPLQFANPALLRLYRQQCDRLLSNLKRSAEFTSDVRHFLLDSPGRFPTIEEAAQQLLVSPRTLRRRLEEEGTTYQQILQDLRRQLATTYLRDSSMSAGEIAHMLGYSDLSNFRRAFIGWTGQSPADYRRQLQAGEP